jgi:hypothetical protein
VPDDAHEHHVGLSAGPRADGTPFIELVPARPLADGTYEVVATPGIANGCAAGDRVRVEPDGSFEVAERGGNVAVNVAVHVYSRPALSGEQLGTLRHRFDSLAGFVESPDPARFAVVTVPVAAGFPAIEAAIEGWVAEQADVEWLFGNVYDAEGRPLGWWERAD